MPYIDVKVAGALTREQKEGIVNDITDSMERHAGKPPAATYITITEVPRDSWAKGGALLE
jgi:4-oxalocrotonate tautomerase